MAQYSILPGQSDTLRRGRIVDALMSTQRRHEKGLAVVIEEIVQETIEELREDTPKDTGAAAGTVVGARRDMYESHPGYGKNIGNNPGDTGWQPYKDDNGKRFAIVNPMWEPYLIFVNYRPIGGGFVERAAMAMRERIKSMRRHS